MPKIVIADKDKQNREFLRISLEQEHFTVYEAANGAEALMVVAGQMPDVLLLEADLPVIDGFEVCRQLRQRTSMPIIFVAAKASTEDRIKGLELGADDYLAKPYELRELYARMSSVLRRAALQPEQETARELHYLDLDINMEAGLVFAFGRQIKLRPKELELLWCLASNPRQIFSRVELLDKIWKTRFHNDTRTVDTHIKSLRQKLKVPAYASWEIITVWGYGYQFQIKADT